MNNHLQLQSNCITILFDYTRDSQYSLDSSIHLSVCTTVGGEESPKGKSGLFDLAHSCRSSHLPEIYQSTIFRL